MRAGILTREPNEVKIHRSRRANSNADDSYCSSPENGRCPMVTWQRRRALTAITLAVSAKDLFFPPRLVVVWSYPSLSGTTATVGLIQTCPWWERSDSTHTGQDCGSCHPASMIALPWDEGATHSKFLLLNRIRLHASRTWFLTTMQITWTMTGIFFKIKEIVPAWQWQD